MENIRYESYKKEDDKMTDKKLYQKWLLLSHKSMEYIYILYFDTFYENKRNIKSWMLKWQARYIFILAETTNTDYNIRKSNLW